MNFSTTSRGICLAFILFWSIVLLVSTTLILVFKADNSLDVIDDEEGCKLSFRESYSYLWKICQIGPIKTMCLILIMCQVRPRLAFFSPLYFTTYVIPMHPKHLQISYGPIQGVAPLKLMDAGLPMDNYALLSLPSLPFIIIMPFLLSNRLTGPNSMHSFIIAYILKYVILNSHTSHMSLTL